MIDIAAAQISYPNKGEDTFVVREIDGKYLLAVADGLTNEDGKAAAEWVAEFLRTTNRVGSIREVYEALETSLGADPKEYPVSETTLTCGLLSETQIPGILVFDFFAIGDSPIWKLVSTTDGRYPVQRYLVHGTPYPAETAKVYATVRVKHRDVRGPVSFGRVEIASDEVLVVCTDGIPEREVMVRDFSANGDSSELRLCQWMFHRRSYSNEDLQSVLAGYEDREVLVDDATLIVVRTAPHPVALAADKSALIGERPERFDSPLAALFRAPVATNDQALALEAEYSNSAFVAEILGGTQSRHLNLQNLGIAIGDVLEFRDGTASVRVVGKDKVELHGKEGNLTKITKHLLSIRGNQKLPDKPTSYWSFNGETLTDLLEKCRQAAERD